MGEKKPREPLPQRSCIFFLIGGAYLIYTGVNLIKGLVTGEEGSSVIIAVFGAAFIVFAAVMIVMAVRSLIELQKRTGEETEQKPEKEEASDETESPDEDPSRPMSIAERARLVSSIEEETEEEKTPETGTASENGTDGPEADLPENPEKEES